MYQIHTFKYNHHTGEIYFQGKCIARLNFSERNIFITLIQSDLEFVERDTLIRVAWPNKIVTSNSLNVAVKNIRNIFSSIGFDDVIITQVKKGFLWNRYYKVFLIEDESLHLSDANTKKKRLTEDFIFKRNDSLQGHDHINLNKDESNENVNPCTLVSSKIESICNKSNKCSIYFKLISIFMWAGFIAHLFLDNKDMLDLERGRYQKIHACIVCAFSSLTSNESNEIYGVQNSIARFEIKLVCGDFIYSDLACINMLSESTENKLKVVEGDSALPWFVWNEFEFFLWGEGEERNNFKKKKSEGNPDDSIHMVNI